MDLKVDRKERLRQKISSGTAALIDWTDGSASSWHVQTRTEDWFWYGPSYRLD
jgi:hypothetical protein